MAGNITVHDGSRAVLDIIGKESDLWDHQTELNEIHFMKQKTYTLLYVCIMAISLNAQTWNDFEQDVHNSGQIGINLWKSITNPGNEDINIFLISSAVVVSSAFADQSIECLPCNGSA